MSYRVAYRGYGATAETLVMPEMTIEGQRPGAEITWGEPVITSVVPYVPKPVNWTLMAGLGLIAAAAWATLA